MGIITLLTDFGIRDGYVGVMKGVIWNIDSQVQIADITHTVSPQNVKEAALNLAFSYFYYPKGTVHIAVVDPGVGTDRRAIAAQIGKYYFVAPDNGLLSLVLDQAENEKWPIKIVELDNQEYWLENVSHVFHGRDIFSPVGAYLSKGVELDQLGKVIKDPIRFKIPKAMISNDLIKGQIIAKDYFGNLGTNIPLEEIKKHDQRKMRVRIAGREIMGVFPTFGYGKPGDLVAVYGTYGTLLIARVNANAAEFLGVGIDEPVEIFIG
ncbi:MAG: SAM-dependent chlorinase/fluorinase [Anaerolineaceae bacterium]|nr:SAM-dependent chlorinase/fluorinase [Anaerolineaceae bacterium]